MRTVCKLLSLLTALVAIPACGGDDASDKRSDTEDEYEADLFPSTHVLGEDAMSALLSYDADGTLSFSGTPAELADIQDWEVVIGGASEASPGGFLRAVTAVESGPDGLVLRTVQAPIQMAFRKLHVKFTRRIDDLGAPEVPWTWQPYRTQAGGSAHSSKDIDFFVTNGDGDPTTTDDQVHVNGKLAGGFDYVFGLDVDWGDVFKVPGEVADCLKNVATGGSCSVDDLLPEAKVGYTVNANAEATLGMEGVAFLPYDAPYNLGTVDLDPVVIGPLWFFPTVEVNALVSGSATSQFSYDMSASAGAGMGVSFSSKSGADVQPPDADFDFSAPSVDATLAAGGRVEVGPELHIRLYKTAGPYAGLKVFAELSADQSKDPCYELHAGITSNFGFDIVTPDLPLIGHATLANWHESFDLFDHLADSGGCKPLPGGSDAPPTGGDPDPASFSKPTFTPWSRSYSDAVYGHPFEGPGAQIEWMDVAPTIDGRFVVAGSDTTALLKLAPDGAVVWAKRYLGPEGYDDTGTNELMPGRILNLADGTLLVVAHPYALLKLESSGELVWAKQFNVAYKNETIRLTGVAPAPDGGYFVAGNAGESRALLQEVDAWLMRFDSGGNLLWSQRWGTPEDGEMIRSLVPFGDGTVAVGATWLPAISKWRSWAARFDADGKVVFSKIFDARECGDQFESSSFLNTGIVAKDGDLVLGGVIEDAARATLVVKLKPDGTLAWFASDGASDAVNQGPGVSRIVELPTSGYLLSGTVGYSETGTYSGNQQDLWLGSTDGLGRLQWLRRYGGHRTEGTLARDSDTYGAASLTRDGGAFLVGFTDSLTPEGNGLWAMKVPAKDGLIDFDPSSTAVTGDVPFVEAGNCLTQSDWTIAPTSSDVQPDALTITVEGATPQTFTHSP